MKAYPFILFGGKGWASNTGSDSSERAPKAD